MIKGLECAKVSFEPTGLPRILAGAMAYKARVPLSLALAPCLPPCRVALRPLVGTSFLAGLFAAYLCDLVTLTGIEMRHSGDRLRQFLSFLLNIRVLISP